METNKDIWTFWASRDPFLTQFIMSFGPTNSGKLRNIITQKRHLGKSKDWIFLVSLATCTSNVWSNAISRICQSIRPHFKRSIDRLISKADQMYTASWLLGFTAHQHIIGDIKPNTKNALHCTDRVMHCIALIE